MPLCFETVKLVLRCFEKDIAKAAQAFFDGSLTKTLCLGKLLLPNALINDTYCGRYVIYENAPGVFCCIFPWGVDEIGIKKQTMFKALNALFKPYNIKVVGFDALYYELRKLD